MESDDEEQSVTDNPAETTEDETRRGFMKAAGAASVGALGALAGCSGSGGNGGETGDETTDGTETTTTTGGDGGEKGVTVLDYWSAIAAETPNLKDYFTKEMREYEKTKNKNVLVNMQALSHSNLKTKFVTAIDAGAGIPDLALPGTFGLQQFHNGNVIDHGPYIEETEGLPDKWVAAQTSAAQYRGEWWAAGTRTLGSTTFGILTDPFKQVGIEDPHKDLQTWTDFRRAWDKMNENDVVPYPYEVTGAPSDVEAYWGNARTAYQSGTDPWIDVENAGTYQEPKIKVNGTDRTDGMILNQIDIGENYSSAKHPGRGNEGVVPMMINGEVATTGYALSVRSIKTLNPDATFGWDDGDFMALPAPRLDPNYGEEFDIPELAGKKGQHGGHSWALETQLTIQEASDAKDEAWDLAHYMLTDERFLLPMLVDPSLNQSIATYKPIIEKQKKDKYSDLHTQPFLMSLDMIDKWGQNYKTTGAAWDIPGTNNIRWTDIGETLSKAYTDSIPRDKTPQRMEDEIVKTMNKNGLNPQR